MVVDIEDLNGNPRRLGRQRLLAQLLGLTALVILAVLGPRLAAAGQPSAGSPETQAEELPAAPATDRVRLVWRPTTVLWPLAPVLEGETASEPAPIAARLDERIAMLEGRVAASSRRGSVEIDGARAAGVWVSALETVRVRLIEGEVRPRFVRIVSAGGAVIEPGWEARSGPGGERRFELTGPPGQGTLWSIESDKPAVILVERVEERSPRYASVEVEAEVLDWIAGGEGIEAMPGVLEPDADLVARLELHAAIAAELERLAAGDKRTAKATRAWRMAAAMAELDRTRPPVRPYFALDRGWARPEPLADTQVLELAVDDSRSYRLAEEPRAWTLDRRGAGLLRIDARTWAPANGQLQPAELRVRANGRELARIPLSVRPALHSVTPGEAIPRLVPLTTTKGDAVGSLVSHQLVVPPGRHDYEIELHGGPALIHIDGARRMESTGAVLRGRTPGRRVRAAARKVAKSDEPEALWLELLLADLGHEALPIEIGDPRFDDLGARSPLLALHMLSIAASDGGVEAEDLARLVERALPHFAALDRDPQVAPAVRGQLRTQWLARMDSLGLGGSPLVEALVAGSGGEDAAGDPVAELPLEGLRLLAELLPDAVAIERSRVLSVLELARAKAPADSDLRAQWLRLWTASSRWSRRRPLPRHPDDEELAPRGVWMVPRHHEPANLEQFEESWVYLPPGRPIRVRAKVRGGPPGSTAPRMRLFDVHVATPTDDPAPVRLRVGDRTWWSPMLEGVERLKVAVPAGIHELELDAPPETVAWAELPPAEEDDSDLVLGRRERMWSLPDSVWRLPGPEVAGFVRLELRWPADVPPEPTQITLRHDGGDPIIGRRVVLFDPRSTALGEGQPARVEIDREATPIGGAPWASRRYDLVLPVPAGATKIWFEVEGDRALAASLSLRRSMRLDDRVSEGGDSSEEAGHLTEVFEGLTSLSEAEIYDELAELSRKLLPVPDDFEARARRAALLLMIGETGHARADLLRLSAWAEREGLPRARRRLAQALLAKLDRGFDALIEPREIVVEDPSEADEPILVAPAIASVLGHDRAELEPWLDTWARGRGMSPEQALASLDGELRDRRSEQGWSEHDELVARLTRAQWLSLASGREREAGRAWLELYGRMSGHPGKVREPIAVGIAAIEPLLEHLDDPLSDARDAALAWGLAREIEPLHGHTSVRRLAFVAALRSDWKRLEHAQDSAGFERLELPVAELQPTPAARTREALLVAPWADEQANQAQLLSPGLQGVLAWDASPGTVAAELWCRAARPDLAPDRAALADDPDALGHAKIELRLLGGRGGETVASTRVELGDGEYRRVELPLVSRARHRLEVELAEDPVWICSWRTELLGPEEPGSDPASEPALDPASEPAERTRELVEPRRRARWWTAESRRGVELVVLGPASLHIEARGVTSTDPARQPSQLIATVERLGSEGGESSERGGLALDEASERTVITESRRRFTVSHAVGHTLLLTDPGPHRIRLVTDRGRAVLRARLRGDRGDIAPPAQVSLRELGPVQGGEAAKIAWGRLGGREGGDRRAIVAREMPRPLRSPVGILRLSMRTGLDDLRDVDDLQPRLGLVTKVGWQREIFENLLWVGAEAQLRTRQHTPTAGGARLDMSARVPVLGLRLGSDVELLAHRYAGRSEQSLRVEGFVDRPTWIGRRTQLRPGLDVKWRWQSLDPKRLASTRSKLEPHPRVYQRYVHDHPIVLRPELELRVFPFQDMATFAEAAVVPNSDMRSLDRVDLLVGFAAIARQPSPWVPVLGADYQASTRFEDADRSRTFIRHRIAAKFGVAVWLRDQARLGFGLRNQLFMSAIAPPRDVFELWLRIDAPFGRRMRDFGPREQWFHEPWAPRAWADDPRQAPSTQTRRRQRRGGAPGSR